MKRKLIDLKNSAALALARGPQSRVIINQKLAGARFEVKNAAGTDGDSTAELYLYGDIAWYDINPADVAQALASITAPKIRVRVNSPGGNAFDGVAIYNAIASHPSETEVWVDGWAASAASIIAMAGDKIVMNKAAMMMIHNAWTITIGNGADHRSMADVLDMIDTQIRSIYSARTGLSDSEIASLMAAETWMDGKTCVDKNFADAVNDGEGAKALVRDGLYKNAPKAASENWKCDPARDLPIDEKDSWDGSAAAERMLKDAGFDDGNPNAEKARRGFLAFDAANPTVKGSYKLPFADLIDGKLTAMEGGLRAAASRLPQTDIPDAVKSSARQVLDDYFARRDNEKGNRAAAFLAEQKRRLSLSAHAA